MVVGIVGVGLLGGSIGYILKRKNWAKKVIGIGRDENKLEKAIELKAIDEYITIFDNRLKEIDILILCVPVLIIPNYIKKIIPYLKKGVIITDIGSTKGDIIREVEKILSDDHYFIGGHPMAGSEKTGVEALDPYIFENAVYVLCKTKFSNEHSMNIIKEMVKILDANILEIDYELHDLAVATVSHVPHVVASSLVSNAGKIDNNTNNILSLAAGGFRDTTRIASGSPEMWKDICVTNADKIVSVIDNLQIELNKFKSAIEKKDEEKLLELFKNGKELRDSLPKKRKGILSTMFEMILYVPDKPGIIGTFTNLLGEHGINIKDIEVLHVRENYGGSIRIAFDKNIDSNKAIKVLTENNYEFKVLE